MLVQEHLSANGVGSRDCCSFGRPGHSDVSAICLAVMAPQMPLTRSRTALQRRHGPRIPARQVLCSPVPGGAYLASRAIGVLSVQQRFVVQARCVRRIFLGKKTCCGLRP